MPAAPRQESQTRRFECPDSSNVADGSWSSPSGNRGQLTVFFRADRGGVRAPERRAQTFEYDDVPLSVYEALRDAPSVGHTFHELVRKGGFQYRQLDDRVGRDVGLLS